MQSFYGGKPEDQEIWLQRTGKPPYSESVEAYEAFETYKNLGLQRTVAKAAANLRKSETLLYGWSKQHEWIRRVTAWDRYSARIKNQLLIAGDADMRERIATQAMNLQARVSKRVLSMTDKDIAELSLGQCAYVLKIASDIETRMRTIDEDMGEAEPIQVHVNVIGTQAPDEQQLLAAANRPAYRPPVEEEEISNVIPR